MSTISDDAFVRLFQERFGLKVDGWAGLEVLSKLDELAPPTVTKADASAIPDDYWPMLSRIESADRPYVQAKSSTASGLYQFIRKTWLGEGGVWGPTLRPAFGGLKPTPAEQLARAKTFTAKNAAYLKARGIPINKASLYAAHFFGPVTAAAVIAVWQKPQAERCIRGNRYVKHSAAWPFLFSPLQPLVPPLKGSRASGRA